MGQGWFCAVSAARVSHAHPLLAYLEDEPPAGGVQLPLVCARWALG